MCCTTNRWIGSSAGSIVCLARLAALDAQIVVTRLPLVNLPGLTERKFRLLKKIFFPRCRRELPRGGPTRPSARPTGRRAGSARTAPDHFSAPRDGTRFDTIHIRSSAMPRAWREILSPWSSTPPNARRVWPSPLRALYLKAVFPERQRVFGRALARPPAGRQIARRNDAVVLLSARVRRIDGQDGAVRSARAALSRAARMIALERQRSQRDTRTRERFDAQRAAHEREKAASR